MVWSEICLPDRHGIPVVQVRASAHFPQKLESLIEGHLNDLSSSTGVKIPTYSTNACLSSVDQTGD